MRTTSDRDSSITSARRVRGALAALALASVLAPVGAAQGQLAKPSPGDSARQAAQCRNAARFLATATPRPRLTWAERTILGCGADAPAALSAATRRLSASRDTADLKALLRAALYVRDAGFFDAALEVASQPTASPEARATGFLVATMQTTDRVTFDLGEILAATEPITGCVGGRNDHSLRIAGGTALPADAASRLRAAIAAVGADAPLAVRNAAVCASAVVGTP